MNILNHTSIPINSMSLKSEINEILNEAIDLINSKLINKEFYSCDPIFEDYQSLFISPNPEVSGVMDIVVDLFRKEGWHCHWSPSKSCFCVHDMHFDTNYKGKLPYKR